MVMATVTVMVTIMARESTLTKKKQESGQAEWREENKAVPGNKHMGVEGDQVLVASGDQTKTTRELEPQQESTTQQLRRAKYAEQHGRYERLRVEPHGRHAMEEYIKTHSRNKKKTSQTQKKEASRGDLRHLRVP